MIRRDVLDVKKEFHAKYGTTIVGDYVTQVLSSYPDGALYLPINASLYRQGQKGSWSYRQATDNEYYYFWACRVLTMLEFLDLFLSRKYSSAFSSRIRNRVGETLASPRVSLFKKFRFFFTFFPSISSAYLRPSFINNILKNSLNKALYCCNRLYSRLSALWLNARILAKWLVDRLNIPLDSSHKELYKIIHRLGYSQLNRLPDLVNCQDFNDRIQWLKLFDQDREIIRCSDKLGVRERVKERLGEAYLAKVYQVVDRFSEIRFEDLPSQFVIKTNHDSGTVLVVRDKSKIDYEAAKSRFDQALRRAYGWANGEWAYAYVKPKVFVEEYLEDSSGSPPDYKFYVVEGTARYCHYIYNRHESAKEQVINIDGEDMRLELYPSFTYGNDFKKPGQWGSMIAIAEAVGRGFKCVRVDLYLIDSRILVGEMTFWPMAGHYKGKGQKAIGQLLDFDRTTFKPFLIPSLETEQSRFSLYSEGL